MANLTIALSDPAAIAKFSVHVEEVLVQRGQLTGQLRRTLNLEAQNLGIHYTDVDQVIAQVTELPRIQAAFEETAKKTACEIWLEFNGAQMSSLVLIVDASQSADTHWKTIHRYVSALIRRLQPLCRLQLFFLGNAAPYNATQFESHGNAWHEENNRRVSLITPVFTTLVNSGWTEKSPRILVFGAGSIFDLADWQDTAMLQASQFFCLGDYLTDGLCSEEETTVENLFTRVCPAISQVVLGADGAIPFYWSNSAYSWEQGRLRFTPPKDKTPSTPAVRVRWLCAPEAVPQAAVTLQNGDVSYYGMVACPPVRAKWRWQSLTQEEADHLRRQLDCPSSHENHPNYATLRDKRGIVLLRDSEKAEYCHLTCPSLRLGEKSSIALWDSSTRQAEIFRFENHNWHRTGEVLSPFHQISENIYAVVL